MPFADTSPWRQPVPLTQVTRLLNHGPTVMVTSAHGGRRNIMSAAWSTPVEFDPPRIAVVIDKSTWTRELIEGSGTLGLLLPGVHQADMCVQVGRISGRDGALAGPDKFAAYGAEVFDGPVLGLPMVAGCLAGLECRLLREPRAEQAYDTFFVEVVSAWADARCFRDGRWLLDPAWPDLRTLHHLGGGVFAVPGRTVEGKVGGN